MMMISKCMEQHSESPKASTNLSYWAEEGALLCGSASAKWQATSLQLSSFQSASRTNTTTKTSRKRSISTKSSSQIEGGKIIQVFSLYVDWLTSKKTSTTSGSSLSLEASLSTTCFTTQKENSIRVNASMRLSKTLWSSTYSRETTASNSKELSKSLFKPCVCSMRLELSMPTSNLITSWSILIWSKRLSETSRSSTLEPALSSTKSKKTWHLLPLST